GTKDDALNENDVVIQIGVKGTQVPVQLRARIGSYLAAQPELDRTGHDLLQVGIPSEEVCQAARSRSVGAGQLRGCRRSVRFGIAAVQAEGWRQLIGEADRGVKSIVDVVSG